MFNLNKQVDEYSPGGPFTGFSIYAPGVRMKRMTPPEGSEMIFKILPAHDPATARKEPDGSISVNPGSWVPFRDAGGNLTPWGRMIYTMPFVGHGAYGKGSNRREFVSLRSYADDDGGGNVFCPITALVQAVQSEPVWRYLLEDRKDPAMPKALPLEKRVLNKNLQKKMLCNIVDLREPDLGVILAEFPTSTLKGFFTPQVGLAMAENMQADRLPPELVRDNPMLRWAAGDLTDIGEKGIVLTVFKDTSTGQGQMSPFVVRPAVNSANQPYRFALNPAVLPVRYNLQDLGKLVPKPAVEQMIEQLVGCLNQWDPTGKYHEYELLKMCFGSFYKVPEPPARGSVSGFSQPPVAQTGVVIGQFAPQAAPAVLPQPAPPARPSFPAFAIPAAQDANEQIPMSGFAPPPAHTAAAQPAQMLQQPQQKPVAPIPGDAGNVNPAFDKEAFMNMILNKAKQQ